MNARTQTLSALHAIQFSRVHTAAYSDGGLVHLLDLLQNVIPTNRDMA